MTWAGTRRGLLLGAGLVAAGARAARAALPDNATLLVPGPEDGAAMRWAARAAAALTRGMPQAVALHLAPLGGPDGVTAANRFATTDADGRNLLVLNGAAAQARHAGDGRVRYDPAEWTPVCCHWRQALLIGRGALRDPRTAPLRLAISAPDGADAGALLALDLLDLPATPVFGLTGPQAEAAFLAGRIDALVGQGLEQARGLGGQPWLDLHVRGLPRDSGEIPTLEDLAPRAPAAMQRAVCAAFAAWRLQAGLMLPRLTPGDVVAAWRHAATRWVEEGAREGLQAGASATEGFAMLSAHADASLTYREWMLRRFGPRP